MNSFAWLIRQGIYNVVEINYTACIKYNTEFDGIPLNNLEETHSN